MIISFGWTTPALLAGRKTVTRRAWNERHAGRFKAGDIVDAWNTTPRNKRGNPHKIATIRITETPYLEWSNKAPLTDVEREGFVYLDEIGATVNGIPPMALWHRWQSIETSELFYVVRFEVLELLAPAASRA